jgi:hypothetical protein
MIMVAMISLMAADCEAPLNARETGIQAQEKTMETVVQTVPVPSLSTAQERKMVSKRAVKFDVENKNGFVYLIDNGIILGYYSIIGKVASLRSYLTPVDKVLVPASSDGGGVVVEAPDIDGTYGENVEGVFFFTDNDVYVEWNGNYLYSDNILPIRVPKLNVKMIE